MDDNIRNLIFQAIDGTISDADFEQLQDAIEHSDDVRSQYLRAVSLSDSLREIASDSAVENSKTPAVTVATETPRDDSSAWRFSAGQLATAATVLILVGGIAFWSGQKNVQPTPLPVAQAIPDPTVIGEPETSESLIAGHATLSRAVDLRWSEGSSSYREGDVLPDGMLRFDEGVAEIDFFCGATLIVEGPAALEVQSDWSVRVVEGRLRANVPPAARGFIVQAAGSEIVDLGTEFALEVGSDNARVEVIDGEVELRGGDHDGNHLVTGQRQWLKGSQSKIESFEGLSTVSDLRRRRDDAESLRFGQWKKYSAQQSKDARLIAYYPIAGAQSQRTVQNLSSGKSQFDGRLVGPVERTSGRFGLESRGLEFDRPGSRVRVRIDGEFSAFTFATWVRIDSLDHLYNSLFMADGYENGEPHWQIREDGRLMLSVMVDDTYKVPRFDKLEQRIITTNGRHRIYYSEPFWDITKSGQWFHIAAVYDPVARRVDQYVNGEQISSEEIKDPFHIKSLRIGPAEIGNWGQPLRKTPWFAVRNLNGTMDELAIFDAALAPEEIQTLYEQGKPLGY